MLTFLKRHLFPFTAHQVPLSEDDSVLSSGYAAAMDAAMHGNHYGAGHHQDPDETTPSDVSERPSVDDVESDTGSTGALETRSLKDHKGNTVLSCTEPGSISENILNTSYTKTTTVCCFIYALKASGYSRCSVSTSVLFANTIFCN